MQSSPSRPSPRGFDDRKRGSAHYYSESHDRVDHNGAPRSPTKNVEGAVEVPISQPGQYQQRIVPVEQRRPPVTNNVPLARGAANAMSRPPAYPALTSEEILNNKTEAARQHQQQRRRGYRRADESGEDSDQIVAHRPSSGRPGPTPSSRSGSNSFSNQSLPITRDRLNSPPKNSPESPESVSTTGPEGSLNSGNTIPRLNSPSVMTSVLQPLDGKVREYGVQMQEAQRQMAQLDSEMTALQERRREAEGQYMAAKTKHDDYRRQYLGVERALQGETDTPSRMSLEDERPTTQRAAPPPQSPGTYSRTESWSSAKKSTTGNRFRMSKLFGSA